MMDSNKRIAASLEQIVRQNEKMLNLTKENIEINRKHLELNKSLLTRKNELPIDARKVKTQEELKEELGDEFDDFMYKSNIELLNKLERYQNFANDYEQYIMDKFNETQNTDYLDDLTKFQEMKKEEYE